VSKIFKGFPADVLSSKPFDFALPICGTSAPFEVKAVPVTAVWSLNKLIVLNGSTSPETNPISGVP
jgi:hypothetical protein